MTAVADAAAIVLFAVVGLLSHTGGVPATGLARDALPLLGGWFVFAAVFGLYRSASRARLVATWAAGVTTGVVVRAAVLGRTDVAREAAFLGVALGVILVLVLAVRLVLRIGGVATRSG